MCYYLSICLYTCIESFLTVEISLPAERKVLIGGGSRCLGVESVANSVGLSAELGNGMSRADLWEHDHCKIIVPMANINMYKYLFIVTLQSYRFLLKQTKIILIN